MKKIESMQGSGRTRGMCFLLFVVFSFSAAETVVVPSTRCNSIAKAMTIAKAGDTIMVENGVYKEKVTIVPGVALKARSQFKAILDGNGKGTVVTLGTNTSICGFEIKTGTIGIVSNSIDNIISQCRITSMSETGISCTGQIPKIEDNIIVYNKGSGIQGWDIRPSVASINHNTIAYNFNNGISIGGNSTVVIENNIIAFNHRIGLKTNEETVNSHLMKNVFFENGSLSDIKLNGNLTCNPKFLDPKNMRFLLQPDSPCKHKAQNDEDPGARSGI